MEPLHHIGCGGDLDLKRAVPFCKKCGKSRKAVERENAAKGAVPSVPPPMVEAAKKVEVVTEEAPPEAVDVTPDPDLEDAMEEDEKPAPKPRVKLPEYAPIKIDGKLKKFLTSTFDPATYDPDDVDHSPRENKEHAEASALLDSLLERRWTTAAQRNDPDVWMKILRDVEVCMKMAVEGNDWACANQAKAVWYDALARLKLKPKD